MKEANLEGSALQFKSTDFIDAAEFLVGRTRLNPIEVEVEKAVRCDDVINNGGQKESGVFALALVGKKLRMRVNATKRRMLIDAAGSQMVKHFAGLKLRLYQTLDSDRKTGGKTSTTAIAMDVLTKDTKQWLRYWDYQQPKGRAHVQESGKIERGEA
jgi:hypothetical protein